MADTKYAVILVTKGQDNDVVNLPKENIKDNWYDALLMLHSIKDNLQISDSRQHQYGHPVSITTDTHCLQLWVIKKPF
jgi:hypothetical protein